MKTFIKISIFVLICVVPIESTFKKLAVTLMQKPQQVRQEIKMVQNIARNNAQRQQQMARQARIEQVGKPLANRAIQQGINKPNIPVINKHHFKIRDQENGVINQIETGDQKMNRLAQEMFESQKNLYELMQEKAALRRAARDEAAKITQNQAKLQETNPKIQAKAQNEIVQNQTKPLEKIDQNQNKPQILEVQKNINAETKNVQNQNIVQQQQKPDLVIDNKDPIDIIINNPTKTFDRQTYQNFLEQSQKFDKYMKNQYPFFQLKPNMQDYYNFDIIQKLSKDKIENTKVYEGVMKNLFKNEKENLNKIEQKQFKSRLISREDLQQLRQSMPKNLQDLKQNQDLVKQFLKQKINIAQYFNQPADIQVQQKQKKVPTVLQDKQKTIQNITNEQKTIQNISSQQKTIQNINDEQKVPSVMRDEQKQMTIPSTENSQMQKINQEQKSLAQNQQPQNSLQAIQNENKGLITQDLLNKDNKLPSVIQSSDNSLMNNIMQNTDLVPFNKGITDITLIDKLNKELVVNNQGNILPMVQTALPKDLVMIPSQLLQKEHESLQILKMMKKQQLQDNKGNQNRQIIKEILGETNPIQHDMQMHQPMQKMLPNDLDISGEQFKKILRQNPDLITTHDVQYFYQFKPYIKDEQDNRPSQHDVNLINEQKDNEINLYPNYLKDQIRVNPEQIVNSEIKNFEKKNHFEDLTEQKNLDFRPQQKIPSKSILPMYFKMNYSMNPLFTPLYQMKINMMRVDDIQSKKKKLPEDVQEKINNFKDEFKKFAEDEQPYLQLLDLPYYNLMLDLEELCIEKFALNKCGQLSYELTQLYISSPREQRRNFQQIRKTIINTLGIQENGLTEILQEIQKNNLLQDLTDKFEKMHGRLEYLLYDYKLKQI